MPSPDGEKGNAMQYDTGRCRLIAKRELAPKVFDFTLENERFARAARPGQFAHVLVPGKTLRRPISICEADPAEGRLRLVFEIRGEGTELLSHTRTGEELDLLAPLGRGFSLRDTSKKAVFVGGGIGVPPLLFAARAYGANAAVLLGFRSASAVILREDFERYGCRVLLATDDGTAGKHGFCTEFLASELAGADAVYACGPTPMLRKTADAANAAGVFCQVSLEERMGCGVGACLVCACKTRRENGEEGYSHVCKDGPVFNAKEVVW